MRSGARESLASRRRRCRSTGRPRRGLRHPENLEENDGKSPEIQQKAMKINENAIEILQNSDYVCVSRRAAVSGSARLSPNWGVFRVGVLPAPFNGRFIPFYRSIMARMGIFRSKTNKTLLMFMLFRVVSRISSKFKARRDLRRPLELPGLTATLQELSAPLGSSRSYSTRSKSSCLATLLPAACNRTYFMPS